MKKVRIKRKHVKKGGGAVLGLIIMLAGSTLATTHFACMEWLPISLVDGFAYFLHGVGAIPFIHSLEPIWALLIGE